MGLARTVPVLMDFKIADISLNISGNGRQNATSACTLSRSTTQLLCVFVSMSCN